MLGEHRLLVVTEFLGIGGTESHLIRVLPRLQALGWQAATFCLSGRGERADELESKGIEVVAPRRIAKGNRSDHRRPVFIARTASSLFWFMRRVATRNRSLLSSRPLSSRRADSELPMGRQLRS